MLNLRTVLAAILLACSALPASAAPAASPPKAVLAPIMGMLSDTNANKISRLNTYYTSNATIVDEFPPYLWAGPTAGTQWWGGLDKILAATHGSDVHATAAPSTRFSVAGNDAYVVVPLTITYKVNGKPAGETGFLTLTLRRSGSVWKIRTQTWATATEKI